MNVTSIYLFREMNKNRSRGSELSCERFRENQYRNPVYFSGWTEKERTHSTWTEINTEMIGTVFCFMDSIDFENFEEDFEEE